MTLTTNAHDITKAEARALPEVPSDALNFSGEHGHVTLFVPPPVAKATADAFNKAMQEHLSASSHVSQASGGGGFSSVASPPRNHHEEIEAAIEQHRAERREEKLIRAKFEEGC